MNRRMVIGLAGLLLISLCWSASASGAQESATSKSSSEATEKPATAYRLDFSVNELEDGKKINTRQYSMNLNANDANEVKIGTRIPVEPKAGEFQYIDVGNNIWSKLGVHNGQLKLALRTAISNFAIPEQASGHESRPVIRQLQ